MTKEKKKGLPLWMPVTFALGAIVLIGGVAARFFLYIPYKQPSGSMYPTILPGDSMWTNGVDTNPARGAVVVFRYPEHRDQTFDKRVIGLPGDVVEMKGRTVLLNGWEIPRCLVGKHAWRSGDESHDGELELEFLGDFTYLVFHDANSLFSEIGGPWHVKSGEYFVLGDNRNNSHDSRMWFGGTGGGVPFADTIGRVRGVDTPRLPPGAEGLRAAFDACLAKKPR